MKKIFTTMVLMFAVMAMNAASLVYPIELKEYKPATYECAYFDFWYFGTNENARLAFVIADEDGKEVAFTVMSTEEADYCAYLDGIAFPQGQYEDRDDASHFYMSTYWILNSMNGVRLGGASQDQEVIAKRIKEVKNGSAAMLALRTGKYQLRVQEVIYQYDDISGAIIGASLSQGYAQIAFSLKGDVVSDLKAEVAADKKTATISWATKSQAFGSWLYLNVRSGAEDAYDNYDLKKNPTNPLTVNVVEGRTYTVTAQYLDAQKKALGDAVTVSFTVGTNNYIPTNLNATVTEDDKVTFTWQATTQADRYAINVYENGFIYSTYNTAALQLSKQIPTGTYTWSVTAMQLGEDGLYYPFSVEVYGNSFTTETAPLPEGTTEMNVWGMEAFYMKDYSQEGKYPWLISLETGESGGTGLPEPWIIVWSNREFALSGSYSSEDGNIEIAATAAEGSCMNYDGTQASASAATKASIRLEFEGFDNDYIMSGYSIPYYSGEFYMECADGKKYHGIINSLMCGPFDWSEMAYASGSRSIVYSMFQEDGEVQALDDVNANIKSTKRLENGHLIIEHNGVEYNVLGTRIK